ncbi:MAG: NUDIX domain-containing protein [Desulfofustis sp.]|nr:NUDIX domain-containing protein [Desulfofustis sp.]
MGRSDHEIVAVVDRDNRLVNRLPRHIVRSQNLPHRAAYILVFNNKNELFLQKRTADKDVFPGLWDCAAGGVVLADEAYEQAARRELFEELGIRPLHLPFHFLHYYEDHLTTVWGAVFTCRHEGPFTLQHEEIAYGTFRSLPEIFALAPNEPITPDGLEILKRIAANHEETP